MPEMLLEGGFVSYLSDLLVHLRLLSFLPLLLCACYACESFICFVKGFVIFPEVQPMHFCDVCGDL